MITPQFQLRVVEETNDRGIYSVGPLPRGYGHTLGNALRRVLLSSLEGVAVTHIRVKGITHPFDTLKGMKEDTIELLLRLKQLRFSSNEEGEQKLVVKKKGPVIVTAKDIQDSSSCSVVNKDLVLCELSDGGTLDMEIYVNRGVGYTDAEEQEDKGFDVIKVDSMYSPVRQVAISVEQTRVNRLTNNDKLTLTIDTDGSLSPREALDNGGKTLMLFVQALVKGGISEEAPLKETSTGGTSKDMMVDELDLPTRVINALVKNKIETVAQLKELSDEDFSKIRGLGRKSVEELKEKLREMDI